MDTRPDADAEAGAAAAAPGILSGPAEPLPVPARPSLLRSLSGRLLVLTIIFVMLSEVLIYVPSVARFQQGYLQGRVEAAYLASLAITAAPEKRLDPDLAMELLHSVGAMAVALKAGDQRALILGAHPPEEMGAVYDLRDEDPVSLIADTFTTILGGAGNALLVVAQHPGNPDLVLEIVLDPAPLQQEIADYSSRIFLLSLMISLITASLVFLALYFLMVRPMRRLTSSMIRFSRRPEDAGRVIRPSGRRDEIGIAEVQLAHMQAEVRTALAQQKRLAALGAAVAKISHDLRNILAGAQLLSDRLSTVEDPTVQRVAPRLIASVDRAIALCGRTLQFGKAEESPPQRRRFALHGLVEEVAATLDLGADGGPRWRNDVAPDLMVEADPEQLYRVLLNLMRNAVEAMAGQGELSVLAVAGQGRIAVEVADTGPGLPEKVRAHLFEPFRGSRSGGTGLGLTIALELVRAHGGDLRLLRSDGRGTTFRLELPERTA
ncbi:nitrogen regulation protein NR(II) [Marinibaculum pumilum]|uniref:Signal transduction histidine-protein kinase/phosphatase MprB n=1 Tax=Marinibaculum pumilum TaxID=1766165 RepID=A0ABV7L627_9PROT